jgi:hypothetical protein
MDLNRSSISASSPINYIYICIGFNNPPDEVPHIVFAGTEPERERKWELHETHIIQSEGAKYIPSLG